MVGIIGGWLSCREDVGMPPRRSAAFDLFGLESWMDEGSIVDLWRMEHPSSFCVAVVPRSAKYMPVLGDERDTALVW